MGELTGASEDVAKRIFHPITVTNSQSPGGDPVEVEMSVSVCGGKSSILFKLLSKFYPQTSTECVS